MIASFHPTPMGQVLADTLVTVQARGTLDVVSDLAVVVLALSLLAVFVALVLFLRRLAVLERKAVRAARRAVDRVEPLADRAGPLVDRSREIADDLEFITRALRTDVERLNASVKALTDRLGQASDRMEERIEEFNALMELVQSEAESIFIDTASTVRGVRAGARSLGAEDGVDPSVLPGREEEMQRTAASGTGPGEPGEEGVYLTGGPDEGAGRTEEAREGRQEPRQETDHAPS